MTSYIGTPTSRVDGRAKVTGAAKYAGEFNTNDLAYGSVVTSSIAKGRIVRIDASEALRVEGVINVLTHENRPRMASTDDAYKDETAPEGSPFRPLYDDRIRFSGQPIALVVAEESEIARFAASLVRIEYAEEAHVTDVYRQRDEAFAPAKAAENMFAPPKAARHGRDGIGCSRGAPRWRILCPDRASQPDGNVCLDGDLRWGWQAHDL
jgi:xanthine dehydrogenase YagR molybdenum-binding subunit